MDVYFSPMTALYLNEACGCVICGTLGSGKTYFSQGCITNCLQSGGRCFIIDPKNDHQNLKHPLLENLVVGENVSFDPFLMYNDVPATLIIDLIKIFLGEKIKLDLHTENLLQTIAADQCADHRKFNNMTWPKFVNYLQTNRDQQIRSIGGLLFSFKDTQLGNCFFGRGNKCFDISGNKSVIITIFGIDLESEKDATSSKISYAILYLIMQNIMLIMKDKSRTQYCTLFIDEAHMVLDNNFIKSAVHNLLTLGRSLHFATVLISQNISHFPNSIDNLITSKFQFKGARQEVEEFLDRLAPKDCNKQYLKEVCIKFKKGECLYIDRQQRIGKVQITVGGLH